ncbi:MAG: hypothetical protein IJ514_03070 [Clostridia bacterium]|nr:hypothetical protein [Clostridia bacterium]
MKKSIKKVGVGILTGIMALSAFAFGGCDTTSVSDGYEKVKDTVTDFFAGEESGAMEYDGTVLTAGETYDFGASPKMAFMSTATLLSDEVSETEEDSFFASSVKVKATVTPSDANQHVIWSVAFVNPSSAWATGKTVTDYVTVTTETEGSTTATVKCIKPFGEQIKLICTSEENANISDYITLDFIQSVKSVSLSFGDLPINLGGQTDVTWEVNPNGVGIGGAANLTYETYKDYTIPSSYTSAIDLISPSYHNGGYADPWSVLEWTDTTSVISGLKISSTYVANDATLGDTDYFYKVFYDIKSLVFDSSFLTTTQLYTESWTNAKVYLYTFEPSEIIEYFSNITDGALYSVRVQLTSGVAGKAGGDAVRRSSLINVTGFTNNPLVKSVTLGDGSGVLF